jgi:hypothetical protein
MAVRSPRSAPPFGSGRDGNPRENDMGDDNLLDKVGGFAADAGVDTFADNEINSVVDGIASHVPGGAGMETVLNTGVDLQANNFINAELGKVEGMFGGHSADADAPAQ